MLSNACPVSSPFYLFSHGGSHIQRTSSRKFWKGGGQRLKLVLRWFYKTLWFNSFPTTVKLPTQTWPPGPEKSVHLWEVKNAVHVYLAGTITNFLLTGGVCQWRFDCIVVNLSLCTSSRKYKPPTPTPPCKNPNLKHGTFLYSFWPYRTSYPQRILIPSMGGVWIYFLDLHI